MEFLIASAIGALTWAGIYLSLRGRTFPVVLGISMLSYAINLFLFAIGRLKVGAPPLYEEGLSNYTDPLPQALVLTAIVISFGMSALTVVLALRTFLETGTDQVDGEPDPAIDPLEGDRAEWIERRNAHRIDMIGEERL
ncbi:Na+/H+ antiporter subunit C [Novosphingobium sp. 1949]|uniref:Na+/H+ antiporter subunit C n=1 Tax=Novosphingobium organovorum TaxID=2930092 RepID=A0ABT0BD67_9SPHN|nr:Na+/H+ antiporter subunit C [Novosphingobium organovorum]